MLTLDAVTVADTFPTDGQQGGAQLYPVYRSNGGYFNVLNNAVYVQLAYSNAPGAGQGEVHWTQPAPFPVGPGIMAPGTVGVRFRNYTPGSIATVSAALSEQGEPPLTITSGGTSTPTPTSGGMQLIQDTLLTGPVAAFTFASIPQTFKDLQLKVTGRSDAAAALFTGTVVLNGDAAAHYDEMRIENNSATTVVGTENVLANSWVFRGVANSGTAGRAGIMLLDLPNYVGAVFDQTAIMHSFVEDQSVTGHLTTDVYGCLWTQATPVTQITVQAGSGNWLAGSRATLYGIS